MSSIARSSNILSKLPEVKTSIFTTMSKLALDYQAINLSQGFPDFSCQGELIELVSRYMRKGHNQYAPMQGVTKLREEISKKTSDCYNAFYHPDAEVTVTSGATEALFVAITTVVRPGDEVILFEPAYDSYSPAVKLAGGICRHVPLTFPDFQINWEVVKEVVNEKTKAIIVNSPHNPSGSVFSENDLVELSKIVDKRDCFIISDEVYEHILFDGLKHQSIMTQESLKERSFVISSFGKTFHTTGWKVGYCLAPAHLTEEFRKIHQFVTFSTSTPMQYALAEFLENKDNYNQLHLFYQRKRDKFRSLIKASRFQILPCSGTYFQLLSYKNISVEGDYELAIRLTKEAGIASIPVSVFYENQEDNKVLRFCFAKEDSTLEAAAEKLCKI